MVDVKISGLPAAEALTGNELLAGLQGTKNVKVLVSAIRAGLAADGNVVHTSGTESIGGTKTFQAYTYFSGGLASDATITIRGDGTGAARLMRIGGTRTADGPAYFDLVAEANRSDYNTRFYRSGGVDGDTNINHRGAGVLALNAENAGSIDLRISGTSAMRVNSDRSVTFGGNAAAMAATRASLGAVGLTGNETIAGTKVFSSEVRIQSVAPSFWLDETDGAPASAGVNLVVDGGTFQAQVRQGGFGPYVRRLFNMSLDGSGVSFDAVTQPWADNTHNLGAGGRRWLNLYVVNAPITGSDKTKKKNLRHMTDAEEAAFLEIAELPSVWEWKVGDRIHGGPTVQDARDVMLDHGLDPWAYSCFCHDSWPAKEAVWREWPAQEEVWEEWPAEDAVYDVVPASYDDDGQVLTPEIRIMVSPAVEAGRRLISEAVEAGRELVEPAVEAGESFSFRVGELHAWMLAAMARRDRREREAAELRLASIEQRLAVLETGK